MIENKTHTQTWLKYLLLQHPDNDPILLEKCCKALALLEALKKSGADFIFRGGTSLLLLFEKPRRLSIDIDIITQDKAGDLEGVLFEIVKQGVFHRVEANPRKPKANIPKAHYKFFFQSLATNSESYVLLDILFEQNPYPLVVQRPINNALLSVAGPDILVSVPHVDCLLGDKFTTIAPTTIGIPFNQEKVLEIGKQFYDLDFLFDQSQNIETVRSSFRAVANQEISYRQTKMGVDDVINDSFEICLTTAFQGARNQEQFSIITAAMKRVRNFSIENKSYTLDDALRVSGKLAYLGQLFTSGGAIEKYSEVVPVKDWTLEDPEYNRINKIKKRSLEAFYYWYKALALKNV